MVLQLKQKSTIWGPLQRRNHAWPCAFLPPVWLSLSYLVDSSSWKTRVEGEEEKKISSSALFNDVLIFQIYYMLYSVAKFRIICYHIKIGCDVVWPCIKPKLLWKTIDTKVHALVVTINVYILWNFKPFEPCRDYIFSRTFCWCSTSAYLMCEM